MPLSLCLVKTEQNRLGATCIKKRERSQHRCVTDEEHGRRDQSRDKKKTVQDEVGEARRWEEGKHILRGSHEICLLSCSPLRVPQISLTLSAFLIQVLHTFGNI